MHLSLHRLALAALVLAGSATLAVADDSKPKYRVLGADRGKVSIVEPDGTVSLSLATPAEVHDLHLLPNGNLLMPMSASKIVERTPSGEIVWSYESKPTADRTNRVEIHAFQPLPDGKVMIAESGNRRIVEVDRAGEITHCVELKVDHPDPHRDTRMVRKLASGNYLVCHEGDATVREYSPDGKVVWSYTLDLAGRPRAPGHGVEGHGTEVFGALRLPSGNTLIATGNGNRVIEVNPEGKTVWALEHNDLPGIQLAWITTLDVRPNGNILFGNCHAGPKNPQLIEVTRDKKVVWTFNNFETFGDSLAIARVLDPK